MFDKKNVRLAGLAALLLSSSAGHAGGLWITEYGQPTMGRAGAGEEAGTDDATMALLNPAAMSRIKERQITVTGGAIYSDIEFDLEQGSLVNGDGDGGSAGSLAPLGSVYYVQPLDDRWTLGLSALALTGSALDYDDDWAGRFQAQDVSIIVAGLAPAVSYRFTDKFSVGLSVPVMYSSLELDIAVPNLVSPDDAEGKAEIDGDDVQAAVTGSFLYEFTESTRIGGRMTSKFEFEYDGNLKRLQVGQQVGLETELTMAAIARLGLMHDFGEKWSGYVTLGWDNWSQLGDVNLSTSSNGIALPRRWEDTYHYALGADYRLSDTWTLRAGAAYDTNPVSSRDRTADMPLDRQVRLAFGADYVRDSGMKISGSLVYADYGDAAINSSRQPPLVGYKGDYSENQIWFAAVAFNWPLGD
jgi:long-chain fatty acid transport protein